MSRTTTRLTATAQKLLTAFILLAPWMHVAAADFDQFKGQPTNQSSKRDNGSCRVLAGKVVLTNIFVSDPESEWDRQQRREVRRRMAQALKFIHRQSARYGQTLQFHQTKFSFAYQDPIPTRLGADPAWTQQVIESAAGESPNDLAARLRRELAADGVLIVLHVNKSARSYNLTYYQSIDCNYRAERIVCFAKYEDDRQTAAGSYAHEILHAFGAGELYFPYDETDSRKQVAARLFPQDIMYRVEYQLRDLEIGDYTAYRIGWIDTLHEKYRVFQDPD
jgi:hypothetical protein